MRQSHVQEVNRGDTRRAVTALVGWIFRLFDDAFECSSKSQRGLGDHGVELLHRRPALLL